MKRKCYICGKSVVQNDRSRKITLCEKKDCHSAAWHRVRLAAQGQGLLKGDGENGTIKNAFMA